MLVAVLLAVAVAGCGGGGGTAVDEQPAERVVAGAGFRFRAPASWVVQREPRHVQVAPSRDGPTLFSVESFRLLKPYRPQLYRRVVGELDAQQRRLTAQLRGRLEASRDVRRAGLRARQYELTYPAAGGDGRLRATYTYLLQGRREYLLVCRWAADAEAPCAPLERSFRLT